VIFIKAGVTKSSDVKFCLIFIPVLFRLYLSCICVSVFVIFLIFEYIFLVKRHLLYVAYVLYVFA